MLLLFVVVVDVVALLLLVLLVLPPPEECVANVDFSSLWMVCRVIYLDDGWMSMCIDT